MSRTGAYAEAPKSSAFALGLRPKSFDFARNPFPIRQNRHDDSLFKATTRPHPGRLTAQIDARPCGRAGHSAIPCYRSRITPCTLIELYEKAPLVED